MHPAWSAAIGPREARGEASLVDLIEQVAHTTSEAGSIDEALLAATAEVCRWTRWPLGRARLVTREQPALGGRWYTADGPEHTAFRHLADVHAVSLGARALAIRGAVWSAELALDVAEPLRGAALAAGLRGGLAVPVTTNAGSLAVLEWFSYEPLQPEPAFLTTATHLGRHVGRLASELRATEAMGESERRFRSVAESANDAIVVGDEHGRIVSWNRAAAAMFGYEAGEVLGKSLAILMPERFRASHEAGLERVVRHGAGASRALGRTFEVAGRRRDGSEFPIELSLATWTTAEGRFFSGIIRDIAHRKRAEARVRALDSAPDSIVRIDARHTVQLANARTGQLFGSDASTLAGRAIAELFAPASRTRLAERLDAQLQGDAATETLELAGVREDGTEFPAEVTLRPADDGGVVTAVVRDATVRKRHERELQRLADHDELTGLFNRRRFEAELRAYAGYAHGAHESGAVLLLDLDRLKYVNGTHGHRVGDEVIRAVGRAVAALVRAPDLMARLGGDEFAVLLKHAAPDDAARRAREIVDAIRGLEARVGGAAFALTASVGVAAFGPDTPAADQLLAEADLAMYAAKDDGGDRFYAFDGREARFVAMRSRQQWAERIRTALDEDRFVLYWQPIVDLLTGEATHCELLLRMVGEDGELVAPGCFIDTAERFGTIRDIDRWVVRRAVALLAGTRNVRLEVNLSAVSIGDPELPLLIEQWLAEDGADPQRLIFEITETAAIANIDDACEFADRVAALGCRFALDDFGAGFSSFAYLKRLPLHYLKIDGDFIRGLASDPTDQVIVGSMVGAARGLGLRTIAEFVEDAATADMLRSLGVDLSQGYHHGRPTPIPAA